jgi:16S rRNA processing protein RimM
MDRPEYVTVGYIRRAHGIGGCVHVESLTDNPTRFEALSEVIVEVGGRRTLYRVERCSVASKGLLIKFKSVDDRSEAEKLKSGYLLVEAAKLPELEEGSYYLFDLIGMNVYTISGELLGEITDVQQYPANDVYIIEGEKGKLLLPAIRDVVKNIDVQNKRMEVELLSGLEFE